MRSSIIWRFFLITSFTCSLPVKAEIEIPLQGNDFLTKSQSDQRVSFSKGHFEIRNPQQIFTVYFHVNKPTRLKLFAALESVGASRVAVAYEGSSQEIAVNKEKLLTQSILEIDVARQGYVGIEFSLAGQQIAPILVSNFRVVADSENVQLNFVRNNKGNMFYWGRRGPSVHLRYTVPKGKKIRYAYTEVTVPKGQDPIGSFYMANGFGQGYFGFQVNSSTERRVLFSVWSPFKTDNPKEIPADQRIIKQASGKGVYVGEFGNEGSGGQSYFVYPWQAGQAYRFLTEVMPDKDRNSTTYTSWFSSKSEGWKLIASFKRPKTTTYLTGFHSFLENFNPDTGYIGRRANFSNVWVVDVDGDWYECTKAAFSVDATGRGRNRLDYLGGTVDDSFFLQNCGFFDQTGEPGKRFSRKSSANQKPQIQFEQLPR